MTTDTTIATEDPHYDADAIKALHRLFPMFTESELLVEVAVYMEEEDYGFREAVYHATVDNFVEKYG